MVLIFGGAMCCIAWRVKKEALKMFMDDDSDNESVTGRPPVLNKVKKMEEMKKLPFYKKQKQPENPLKREARLEKARVAALKKKEAERLAEEKKNKKKKPVSNGSPLGSSMDGDLEAPRTPTADEEEGGGAPGPWSTYSYAYEKTVEAERKKKAAEHEAWKAEMMGELAAAEEAAQKDAAAEERAAILSRERQEAIARDRVASFSALPPQTSRRETPTRGASESKESTEDFKALSADKRASKKAAEAERRKAKRAAAEAEAKAWQAQRMNKPPEQI